MDEKIPTIAAVVLLVTASGAWLALMDPGAPLGAASGPGAETAEDGSSRPYDWLPERSAEGEIPSQREALTKLENVGYVDIEGNQAFAPANAVSGGSGTPEDPYVISGVYARQIDVRDTDAWFTVENSYIGTLRLNWNDQNAWVHHNRIGDLRVNENDPRTGNATGGVIEHNAIGRVGQIRHYDGIFRHNVVGQQEDKELFDVAFSTFREAINVDGYVNAEFYENKVLGEVVLDLHGHGHASCRGCHPHNHYASMNASERRMENDDYDPDDYEDKPFRNTSHPHEMDHSRRYHTIRFHDNVIVDDEGRGLYIEDRNHDADDRTANSEPDPELIGDHWHDVLIEVEDNTIKQAGIVVDIMVARDEYHVPGTQVHLRLAGNTIEANEDELVDLHKVRNATVEVVGNELVRTDEMSWRSLWQATPWTTADGVRLDHIGDSEIRVESNTISDLDRGVAATEMPASTTWRVVDNTFDAVDEPVWWDDTVANEPVRDA